MVIPGKLTINWFISAGCRQTSEPYSLKKALQALTSGFNRNLFFWYLYIKQKSRCIKINFKLSKNILTELLMLIKNKRLNKYFKLICIRMAKTQNSEFLNANIIIEFVPYPFKTQVYKKIPTCKYIGGNVAKIRKIVPCFLKNTMLRM